jgi:hypothetical protein
MKFIIIKLGVTMIYITQYQTHLNSIKELIYQELKVFNHLPQYIKAMANDQKCFKVTLKKFLCHHSFYSVDEYYEYKEKR